MNVINSFLYRACEWIMKFAIVNFLWFIFTLFGAILFGFFPSTIAMFSVVRKWVMGEPDVPIFKTYWATYKKEYMKGNLFGLILLGIVGLIYFDYRIIAANVDPLLQWSKYPLLISIIFFSLILLYSFPTYVHYDINVIKVLKNSLFIMLINPVYTCILLLGMVLIYLLAQIIPALLFFFGSSATCFVVMWPCYQSFIQVEKKKERLKTVTNEP